METKLEKFYLVTYYIEKNLNTLINSKISTITYDKMAMQS